MIKTLSREQVISVIEGKGAADRVPTNFNFWVNTDAFGENKKRMDECAYGFLHIS